MREKAKAKEQLEKAHDSLEIKLRERTAEFESSIELLRDEITYRIEAEKTLIESEELLSAFMDSATDAFALWDSELNLIRANKAYINLFPEGTRKEHIIGENITDLIPDIRESGRLDMYSMVIKTGEPYYSGDIITHQKFGSNYMDVKAFRVSNGLGLIVRDITEQKFAEEKLYNTLEESNKRQTEISALLTERKLSEKALRNSEETLKLALEVAKIGSWVWEINTNKLIWSQKVYEIFGLNPEKPFPLFEDFINCLHPDDLELVTRSIAEAVKNQKDFDVEYRIIRPADRKEKIIHARGKAIYDDKGKADRMMGMVQDITERKKIEEEQQKIQKLESIGILAGGIAHDFNNLLAGILNNVYLSKIHIDRESKEYKSLESAEKAIYRAANLTQQLLTFSRGGAPIRKTAFIMEIIEESAEFVLRGSNVNCKYNVADDLWPVEVDEGQINQVIQNLILNAKQAMSEGGMIRICVENLKLGPDTGLPLQEGKYLKILIQDQGIGIEKEHQHKIFDPYFTTKEAGRGLGLSITYSIIKNHEGLITVESEKGTGTTFTIYLLVSEKKVEEKKNVEDTRVAGNGKILLMDDEEIIRESVGEFLTMKGFEIEIAKDGKEAIELYRKTMETSKPFDALILDLTIRGGMGGKEVLKKLQKIDPYVKAIVSSGYSNDPVMANFEDYGFSDVFCKASNSPDELCMILNKVVKG